MINTRQAKANVGNRIAFGILIILVSLFCFLCDVHAFGGVGRMVYSFITGFFGLASYGYLICGILIGLAITLGIRPKIHVGKALFLILMFVLAVLALQIYSSSAHIIDSNYGEYLVKCYDNTNTAGGMLFGIVAFPLMKVLTTVGSLVVICAIFFLLLLIQIMPLIKKNMTGYEVENTKSIKKKLGLKFGKKILDEDVILIEDVDFPSITDFSKGKEGIIRLDVKSTQTKSNKKLTGTDNFIPLEEIKEENYKEVEQNLINKQTSFTPNTMSQKDLLRQILFDEEEPTDEMLSRYQTYHRPDSAFDNVNQSIPTRSQTFRDQLGIGVDEEQIRKDFNERYQNILSPEREERSIYVEKEEKFTMDSFKEPENTNSVESDLDDEDFSFEKMKEMQMNDFKNMFVVDNKKEEEKKEVVPPTKVQTYENITKYTEEKPSQQVNTGISGALNRAINNIPEEVKEEETELESEAYEERESQYSPIYSNDSISDFDRGNYKAQSKEVKMPRAFENSEVTIDKPAKSYEQLVKERKIKQALSETPDYFDFEKEAMAEEERNAPVKIPKPRKTRTVDEQEQIVRRLEKIDPTKPKVIQGTIEQAIEKAEEEEKPMRPFTAPPLSLLDPPAPPLDDLEGTEQIKEEIAGCFKFFSVNVEVFDIIQGPTFTLYKCHFELPRGKQVQYLLSLESDIAMAMRVESVRITLIPTERAIGIEVPNKHRRIVKIIEIIDSKEFRDIQSPAIVPIGQDLFGRNKIITFDKLPHALVAGTTGSGKSCMLHQVIMSLIYKSTPEEVRMIIIDPKLTEFSLYNGIPHLLVENVINDVDKAIKSLNWALGEMDRRNHLLQDNQCRNIDDYNKIPGIKKMPRIIILCDEFAELIDIGKRAVEDAVNRLARLARATGIHMILATQRPSVDVIPGTIKNNFPSRCACRVSTNVDSKTIIDTPGAEKLLGAGDCLYKSDLGIERIQNAYATNDEIKRVCKWCIENNDRQYDSAIKDSIYKEPQPEKSEDKSSQDGGSPFPEGFFDVLQIALELAEENAPISASLIQRKLGYGWNRSARMYDFLKDCGYLAPIDPSKPKVLKLILTREEVENLIIAENAANGGFDED